MIYLQIISYKGILLPLFVPVTLFLQKNVLKCSNYLQNECLPQKKSLVLIRCIPQTSYISDGPSEATRDKNTYIVYVSK